MKCEMRFRIGILMMWATSFVWANKIIPLPTVSVPIDQVLPTQPYVCEQILCDKMQNGPTSILLIPIGEFEGKPYYGIWDGHHSVFGACGDSVTGTVLPRGGMDEILYAGAESRALQALADTPQCEPVRPKVVPEFPGSSGGAYPPRDQRPKDIAEAMGRRPCPSPKGNPCSPCGPKGGNPCRPGLDIGVITDVLTHDPGNNHGLPISVPIGAIFTKLPPPVQAGVGALTGIGAACCKSAEIEVNEPPNPWGVGEPKW